MPWVREVFLACGRNFRCWPKTDTSSAIGRSKVSGTQGNGTTTERQLNPIVELPANKPKPVHPHDQILSVIYFSFSFLTIRLLIKHSPHVRPHQEGGPILRIFWCQSREKRHYYPQPRPGYQVVFSLA